MRIRMIVLALALVLAGCASVGGVPRLTVAARTESNLRAGPSVETPVVGLAAPGQVLTVFGRQGNWIQVGDVVPRGWIYADLVY
jgi:uncharacterized protein YraI